MNSLSQIEVTSDTSTVVREIQTADKMLEAKNPEVISKSSSENKNETIDYAPTKPPGPKAFIVKNKVKLFEKENTDSAVKKILSKNTTIYILETSFTDDKGNIGSFPTWYKIQTEDNLTGWVEGNAVSAGH